jgi:G6PDH family F420-dependent oxidoreductase
MVKIAYHCSMEQFSPSELMHYAIQAEKSGFKHLSCSDHLAPWSRSQGHSGNAWCWMGAVLSATEMSCGTVCSPGYRYHPVVVAQMAATLAELFPNRFWLALGSGEYLNEQFITPWPEKNIRNEILKESFEIIRLLLDGKEVTYPSEHLEVHTARLYILPKEPLSLFGAALSTETTKFIEPFTDGLITTGLFDEVEKNVHQYQKKKRKKLILKMNVSYASTPEKAIDWGWQEWRYTQIEGHLLPELRYPEQFEEAAQKVTKEQFSKKIIIACTPDDLRKAIHQFSQLGFDQINLHNVNKDQESFIAAAAQLL